MLRHSSCRRIFREFIFLLFVFLLHSFSAATQNNIIDSLQKVLLTQKEDTNKVNTLNELASELNKKSDYTNSLPYAKAALVLSEKKSFKKGTAFANKNLGY